MIVRLKVCGMRDATNIQAVSEAGADYLGFIFYKKSPRYVGDTFEMPAIAPTIQKVGVFVDETLDEVKRKANRFSLDLIQLHGTESPAYCASIRAEGVGVIKTFSVDDDFNFEKVKPFKSVVDYFLFDTKGKLRGGNSLTFNWEILTNYNQEVPFFLSGGISEISLDKLDVLKGMNLYAIDINSGVEVSPGLKDPEHVKLVNKELELLTAAL